MQCRFCYSEGALTYLNLIEVSFNQLRIHSRDSGVTYISPLLSYSTNKKLHHSKVNHNTHHFSAVLKVDFHCLKQTKAHLSQVQLGFWNQRASLIRVNCSTLQSSAMRFTKKISIPHWRTTTEHIRRSLWRMCPNRSNSSGACLVFRYGNKL